MYIDFPPDYNIVSYDGKCTINTLFSFNVKCTRINNRFYINSTHPDWNALSQGTIETQIQHIRGPDLEGETRNFVIYNYDKSIKVVVGRTYANLYKGTLSYQYDGAHITVNEDKPIKVEVGTYTDVINMTVVANATRTIVL